MAASHLSDFSTLCASEHPTRSPNHFGSNLNVKADGKLYIKDVLIEDSDCNIQTTRRGGFAACLSKAIYNVQKEFSPETYQSGEITKQVWKLFTKYRDEWLTIRRAGGVVAYQRKLERERLDKERGQLKRFQKEELERQRIGDEAFNKRMREQGATKLNTQKPATVAELKQFKEWYAKNEGVYTKGLVNNVKRVFLGKNPLLTFYSSKRKTLLISQDISAVLTALQAVQEDNTISKFYCSVKLEWESFSTNFPVAHCFTNEGACPILHSERLASGVTFDGILQIKGNYIVTDKIMGLYKCFEKEWERFESYNPKKSNSLNVCYQIQKCLSQVTLTSDDQEITIQVAPLCSKPNFTLADFRVALGYKESLQKVMNSVDSRISQLEKQRELSIKEKIENKANSPTQDVDTIIDVLNKNYFRGLMDFATYTKAMLEISGHK